LPAKTITVIGGSIAGLGTALEILKKDSALAVTVHEKNADCSRYTCAGGVSSFMFKKLQLDIPDSTVAAEIRRLRIYSPNGSCWETKARNSPYGLVLRRDLFQLHLAREIQRLGGKIVTNSNVDRFERHSDIFVAADGLMGSTRRLLELPMPSRENIHLGVQTIARLEEHPRDCISLYFGSVAPDGYAWVFPHEGPDQCRIGLGVPLNLNLNARELLTDFLFKLEAVPTKMRAKLIPTAKPAKDLVHTVRTASVLRPKLTVMLVGDAALFCDPATGGGIVQGLLSAKNAARAICEGKPLNYERYCSGLIRTNLFRYKLKQVLCELTDEDFNILINTMQDFHPDQTSVGRAIIWALAEIAMKNPRFLMKHRVLRKLLL